MDQGLNYSEEALLNRVLFYSDYNDINIFVEDEGKEYVYERIFERMFGQEIKISRILPMNGKAGVENAFNKFGQQYDNKPAIYLVDGDFDLVMKKEMIKDSNYIYLERYNIESYYIDENAVLIFMAGKMKKEKKYISKQLGYNEWKENVYKSIRDLFINYMVAQANSIENVGTKEHRFFQEDGFVNIDEINDYISKLKDKVPNYEVEYNRYKNNFETILLGDDTRLVCGKYLLASLTKYLRNKLNVNFKNDDFVFGLVSEFDIKTLDFVKDRIIKVMKKH